MVTVESQPKQLHWPWQSLFGCDSSIWMHKSNIYMRHGFGYGYGVAATHTTHMWSSRMGQGRTGGTWMRLRSERLRASCLGLAMAIDDETRIESAPSESWVLSPPSWSGGIKGVSDAACALQNEDDYCDCDGDGDCDCDCIYCVRVWVRVWVPVRVRAATAMMNIIPKAKSLRSAVLCDTKAICGVIDCFIEAQATRSTGSGFGKGFLPEAT